MLVQEHAIGFLDWIKVLALGVVDEVVQLLGRDLGALFVFAHETHRQRAVSNSLKFLLHFLFRYFVGLIAKECGHWVQLGLQTGSEIG